ncbi:MAG: hypothetical protein Q8M39_03120 [Sulfuricurvum sp.]|nr:hypothetical protein [Sulfuricurvum sp.]
MSSRSIEVDFKTRMIARILDCLPKTVKKYRSQKVPIVALLDNFTPYLLEKFCNGNELRSDDFFSSAVDEKNTQKIVAGIKEKKQRKDVQRTIYADKITNFSLLIRSAITKVKEDEKQFGPFSRDKICMLTYILIAEKKGLLGLTSEEITYIDTHGFESLKNLTEDDLRIWYIDMINKTITLEGTQKRWMK